MRQELDEALCRDFPNLFRDRDLGPEATGMCFGFQCEDGWEPLIRKAAETLERLILALPLDERENVRAFSVKQKFGTLLIYMTLDDDQTHAVCAKAEAESQIVCERCGAPGKLGCRKAYWQTLCEVCRTTS